MESLALRAAIAGIFFGIWPLLLNRSGLSGNFSSFIYVGIVLICVLPFAFKNVGPLAHANWWMAIGAGITGAIGLLAFNGMLAKATPAHVSALFVVMIIVQTAIPAIYQLIISGHLSWTKGLGFILAAAAAWLLVKT